MSLIPNPTTSLIEHVLRFRNHRHDALASNIANANTPGYRSFDVVLDQSIGGGAGLPLRRSDPRHLEGRTAGPPISASSVTSTAPARLDGNNVSLDDEFLKISENRIVYQAGFELYEKFGELSRIAREVR